MPIPPGWSAQKLAEFLAAVSSFSTEAAAALGAAERVAEYLDAEVAAIVSHGSVVAVIGYPSGEVPVAELDAVARGARDDLTVPGAGPCRAVVMPLEHPPGAQLVVARSGGDALGEPASEASALSPDELGLLQGMARVTSMTLRMLGLLDDERALRKESERQSAENARLLQALTEHQKQLEQLAEEQAALRRVATLVAKGASPSAVFSCVVDEIARNSHVDHAGVARFDPDGTATVVANRGVLATLMPVNSNWPLDGDSVTARVARTGRPARMDGYANASGSIAAAIPGGAFSTVGAPIVINDQLWGAAVAMAAIRSGGLPADAEERIANFADLIATAISNAHARSQLTASRARVVAAADDARRRLERDLHDGVLQGLVALALDMQALEAMVPAELPELREQVTEVADGLTRALDELREMSRGIHPAVLSEGGLEFALKALARRAAVSVKLGVRIGRRLPERIEVAAYHVVAEALTNAAKHARASTVEVEVDATDGLVRIVIRDDGVGGADLEMGSGLIGLVDRVEALGGKIRITSPAGGGTTVRATLPVEPEDGPLE